MAPRGRPGGGRPCGFRPIFDDIESPRSSGAVPISRSLAGRGPRHATRSGIAIVGRAEFVDGHDALRPCRFVLCAHGSHVSCPHGSDSSAAGLKRAEEIKGAGARQAPKKRASVSPRWAKVGLGQFPHPRTVLPPPNNRIILGVSGREKLFQSSNDCMSCQCFSVEVCKFFHRQNGPVGARLALPPAYPPATISAPRLNFHCVFCGELASAAVIGFGRWAFIRRCFRRAPSIFFASPHDRRAFPLNLTPTLQRACNCFDQNLTNENPIRKKKNYAPAPPSSRRLDAASRP